MILNLPFCLIKNSLKLCYLISACVETYVSSQSVEKMILFEDNKCH